MGLSLYMRIGGDSAVTATVVKLYEKLLDDPQLAPFFEDINVEHLRLSQTAFVTHAFGGPSKYRGKSLRIAHANAVAHGLSDEHFNLTADHLRDAMHELGVDEALITEALAIVESTRDDVLNR